MRANRKPRLHRDDRAQVGIGTMIVFIATVLVAAIAAGVIIDTSGKLQERSARTGQETTQQVSSNIIVDSLMGRRNSSSDNGLKFLYMYVSLAPGASEVDLSELRIQISNKTVLKTLQYVVGNFPADGKFSAKAVRDADSSFTNTNPVMNTGDLVNITIFLDATNGINMELQPREQVNLLLLPEIGNKVSYGFNTPPSYGVRRSLQLR
jgi:archaeal flagellin FlaB